MDGRRCRGPKIAVPWVALQGNRQLDSHHAYCRVTAEIKWGFPGCKSDETDIGAKIPCRQDATFHGRRLDVDLDSLPPRSKNRLASI